MACTILIVDDDRELHELYAAMLEDMDCQIVRAYDGGEAWEKLQSVTPDLILLDIILDEMMGDALFARVKQDPRYRDIPIVIVSVLSAERCRHMLEAEPDTLFLRKPFQRMQLLDAVNRGLAQSCSKECR